MIGENNVVWNLHILGIVAVCTSAALAQSSPEVCDSDGGPEICARFDNVVTAPVEDTHFTFTFDGSGIPSVEFLLGDDGQGTTYQWRVWSKDGAGDPAEIGDIAGVGAEDYTVRILQPDDDPGATDVGSINLDPSAGANFTRVWDGHITGDIAGDLFLQAGNGTQNGRCSLLVDGDVVGAVSVPAPDGLEILGDVSGAVTASVTVFDLVIKGSIFGDVDLEDVAPSGFIQFGVGAVSCVGGGGWTGTSVFNPVTIGAVGENAQIWIVGHLQNDLTISGLHEGQLRVGGHIGNNGEAGGVIPVTISIADMSNGVPFPPTLVLLNYQSGVGTPCEFHGELDLLTGVPSLCEAVVAGELVSGSTIDLNAYDVDGALQHWGDGSGSIVNGGTVTQDGLVVLGDDWTGTATFTDVELGNSIDQGVIRTENKGDLDGTLHITGAMLGDISVVNNLNSTGTIDIDGECAGDIAVTYNSDGVIDISGTLAGDVRVGQFLTGEVAVTGGVSGDIDVDGDVASSAEINLGSYLRNGRILVDGLMDGFVAVKKGTTSLSQINLFGGVGPNGQVVINAGGGNDNADGDIWVGSTVTLPPLSPIDFDGCFQINDNAGAPRDYGHLNGDITVVGCHADGDKLPICVEGSTNGSISLIQSLCSPANATVDASCPACP